MPEVKDQSLFTSVKTHFQKHGRVLLNSRWTLEVTEHKPRFSVYVNPSVDRGGVIQLHQQVRKILNFFEMYILPRYSHFFTSFIFEESNVRIDKESHIEGVFYFNPKEEIAFQFYDMIRSYPEIFFDPRSELTLRIERGGFHSIQYKFYYHDYFMDPALFDSTTVYLLQKEELLHYLMMAMKKNQIEYGSISFRILKNDFEVLTIVKKIRLEVF